MMPICGWRNGVETQNEWEFAGKGVMPTGFLRDLL